MDRISFKYSQDRFDFFQEARKNANVESWKELANILKTNRCMLDNYRSGNFFLPENRFLNLLKFIDLKRRNYFLKMIERRGGNWGAVKGGIKTYLEHKEIFENGRKIGSRVTKFREGPLKYNFNLDIPLSEDLCEFIGAIIGDGFTNRYCRNHQTQITGDRRLDSEYYFSILKPTCEKLFNISPKIICKDNLIRLNINSKRLYEMLTKRFCIPAGVKCYSVKIPLEIINSKRKFINATLRGMFNTDGGVGFDKRAAYKKPYIRVNYTSASYSLIEQIRDVLFDYNIAHSIHKRGNTWQIQINGEKNVKLFLSKIGFSNERHLSKLRYLN